MWWRLRTWLAPLSQFQLGNRFRVHFIRAIGQSQGTNVGPRTGEKGILRNAGGTVRLSRRLGSDADLGTLTLTFAPAQVDIFPSGVSTAALTATITSGISTRTVTLSTAGLVRIP